MKKSELRQLIREVLTESNMSIRSLNDIKTALHSLYPNIPAKFYNDDRYDSPIRQTTGYLYAEGNHKFVIFFYDKSQHSSKNVGVLYINGNETRGYEFDTISELSDILRQNKINWA